MQQREKQTKGIRIEVDNLLYNDLLKEQFQSRQIDGNKNPLSNIIINYCRKGMQNGIPINQPEQGVHNVPPVHDVHYVQNHNPQFSTNQKKIINSDHKHWQEYLCAKEERLNSREALLLRKENVIHAKEQEAYKKDAALVEKKEEIINYQQKIYKEERASIMEKFQLDQLRIKVGEQQEQIAELKTELRKKATNNDNDDESETDSQARKRRNKGMKTLEDLKEEFEKKRQEKRDSFNRFISNYGFIIMISLSTIAYFIFFRRKSKNTFNNVRDDINGFYKASQNPDGINWSAYMMNLFNKYTKEGFSKKEKRKHKRKKPVGFRMKFKLWMARMFLRFGRWMM